MVQAMPITNTCSSTQRLLFTLHWMFPWPLSTSSTAEECSTASG